MPIIEYVLDIHCPDSYRVQYAEGVPAGRPLVDRVKEALDLYPCDVLFVHRDAEQQPVMRREQEIDAALNALPVLTPHVKIVPVRMTEAWLLLDEAAIRAAANNRRGQTPLDLPAPPQAESVDAKLILFSALTAATELGARRLQRFNAAKARQRVPYHMADMARLRQLPSFLHFERQVVSIFK